MSIRLVPVALEHAPAIQMLACDPRIAATTNVPSPYPPDGAATWIRFTMAQRELGSEMNFAIFDGGTLVGVCGVLAMNVDTGDGPSRDGVVGYWIGVPYWGQGYATAAATELLRVAFEEKDLGKLRSACLVRNPASRRVLEKVGFRFIGYGSHPASKWTIDDRFAMFELTKDEWRAVTRR